MQDIKESRKIINEVDEQMARLFEQRMQACEQIALYKKENGLSVRDSEREEQVVANNAKLIQNPALVPYYKDFIRSTMDVSCHYQASFMRKMRVAYCGTEGAFAHIAAKRMYPDAEYIAFSNFQDAYDATQKGDCDCSVLPLENSYAGEVGEVMDLIFSGDLHVNQVVDVAIAHNLIAKEGAQIEDIKTVLSHPQALAQCEEYIKNTDLKRERIPTPLLPQNTLQRRKTHRLPRLRRMKRQGFSRFRSCNRTSTTIQTTPLVSRRFQERRTYPCP